MEMLVLSMALFLTDTPLFDPGVMGWTPELWGQSAACRQLVRKNKRRHRRAFR